MPSLNEVNNWNNVLTTKYRTIPLEVIVSTSRRWSDCPRWGHGGWDIQEKRSYFALTMRILLLMRWSCKWQSTLLLF